LPAFTLDFFGKMNAMFQDLKIALGQCFWIGINGTTLEDPYTTEIFQTFQPGGICLFQRNVESADQVTRLNASLQKASKIPMFVAVDQEGGVVERLHKIIGSIPPSMALAATRKPLYARRIHESHAKLLRTLGFNVNFTPVFDLALQNADNGLGTRCFSNHPEIVIRYAQEVLDAHLRFGVLPCGKHFPGLGDTDRDSHLDLPTVPRSWNQIEREDLVPYKKLLNKVPFIMVNHALYPEKNRKLPASLAKEIVTDVLLQQWKYEGFSISDDLIMGAVSNVYNLADACEKALLAGNHLFLICRPEEVTDVFAKMLRRVEKSEALQNILFRNSSKILSFKYINDLVRTRKHSIAGEVRKMKKLTEEASQKAITLLKGESVKFNLPQCSIFFPRTKWLIDGETELTAFLTKRGTAVNQIGYPTQIEEADGITLAQQSKTEWNLVIVTNPSIQQGQMSLIQELLRKNKRVLVVSGAFPADTFPDQVSTVIAAYWTSAAALKATARALFGDAKIQGLLPFQ
jgi:beta-N-acetylhexosaminidase